MENVQIKDEDGNLILEFDGEEWKIYSDYSDNEPKVLYKDFVEESPFYLFYALEDIDDATELMIELSQKSTQMKKFVDKFFAEKIRLKRRTILFEKYGSGMVDDFTDCLTISENLDGDFVIETSIETDFSDEECKRNAIGEIFVERVENVKNARQLYDAILNVTSDSYGRWENIDWSWSEIIENLELRYPKLASELVQYIEINKVIE